MDRGLRKEEDKIKEDKEYEPIQTITMKTFPSKIYKQTKIDHGSMTSHGFKRSSKSRSKSPNT